MSRIRSAVFGNSRQFFIIWQNGRAVLDDRGNDVALPKPNVVVVHSRSLATVFGTPMTRSPFLCKSRAVLRRATWVDLPFRYPPLKLSLGGLKRAFRCLIRD